MKKNEHVNELATLNKTNKNTKNTKKETECAENKNDKDENKVLTDCDMSQICLETNIKYKYPEDCVMKNTEQVNDQPTDSEITGLSVSKQYKNNEIGDDVNNNDKHEHKVPSDGDGTHQIKNDKLHTAENNTERIDTHEPEKDQIPEYKS